MLGFAALSGKKCGRMKFVWLSDSAESGLVFGVFDGVRGQELQRDGPFELRIGGLIDDTHPAFTEFPGDHIVRDGLAYHGGRVVPWFR